MANKQDCLSSKPHSKSTDNRNNSLEVNGGFSTAKKRRLRKKRSIARQNIELEQSQVESRKKVVEPKPGKTKPSELACKVVTNKPEILSFTHLEHININKVEEVLVDSKSTCNHLSNDKHLFVSTINMASKEILREDVLAKREAKKLLKQKAKTKETETSKPTIEMKKDLNVVVKTNKVNSKTETKTSTVSPVTDSKDEQIVTKPVTNVNLSTNESSREHVLAEREAKKLAKQLSKMKNLATEKDLSINVTSTKKNETLPATDGAAGDPKVNATSTAINHTKLPEKSKVDDITVPENTRSKAELRAERRAKQDAQRAAKDKSKPADIVATEQKTHDARRRLETKVVKATEGGKVITVPISDKPKAKTSHGLHQVKLFQHLYAEREAALLVPRLALNSKDVHPAIVRLGVQNASRVIVGSNARCIAFLNAIKQVVTDYVLPAKAEFTRGLEAHLKPSLAFLTSTRPLAVSMINALKHFRWQLAQLPNAVTEYDAKTQLNEAIDTYIREQVEVAGQAISNAVRNKISNSDVILIYGCSSLIEKILKDAWKSGLHFRTVVVGSRSSRDGVEMLRRLTAEGLPCTYINISALSYAMGRVNKVLLGAGALLVNGSVMARAGTSQVALVANAFNVPVLVCCETHKFSERVQTDSFVYNEIGEPDDLMEKGNEKSPLRDWQSVGSLTPLNLTYDVTPPNLVTAVVTELAILPCTSVPVVLRFKLSEYGV